MPSTHDHSLHTLFAQIETAWEERGDAGLVDRLAAEHPERAEELYSFFDAITAEDEDLPPGAGEAAVRNTLAWLKEEHEAGLAEVAAAREGGPSPPQDLMGLLVEASGRDPLEIAEAMEDTPLELLDVFTRYPQLVRPGARRALAARAHRGVDIAPYRVLRKLDESVNFASAASRQGGYGSPPASYEDLLDLAGLSPELRSLWLRLGAQEGTP
jgi:hypothetical protein